MKAVAVLLVVVAVGLFAVSGLCAPGSDCAHGFTHAQFVTASMSSFSFVAGAIGPVRPVRPSRYDSVVADPQSPPPRA